MKGEVLSVINPHAGSATRQSRQVLTRLLPIAGELGEVIKEESLAKVRASLDKALARRPKVICVFGGDGTTYHFLNIVLKKHEIKELPCIVPLKGGTMNILAKDANLDMDGDRTLLLLKEALDSGEPLKTMRKGVLRCTLKAVEGFESDGEKRDGVYYGLTFAKGLPYEVMREYDHLIPSRLNAARLVVQAMFWPAFRQRVAAMRHMVIKVNGSETVDRELLGMVASTVNRTVLDWKPFWEEIHDVERQFSFLASALTLNQLLPFFPAVFWGIGKEFLKRRGYLYQQVGGLRIESDRGFTLDGEQVHLDAPNVVEIKLAGTIQIPILTSPIKGVRSTD